MRTTYFPFIDESTPEGSKTLADSAQDQIDFGVGISSNIGIGTVNNPHAQFAIHFDGSEDNRTGGFEVNGNSNSPGDKHGARILAYNRVKANKGFRRLRFQASEYSIETPDAGISSTNSGPTLNITGFGSVGIGTTDPLAKLDIRGDVRFNNKLYDKDGDSGTSGQVLSSTGTQVDWINIGTLSAGTASQVAVTASNDNSNFNITFVDSTSGNQSIKADTTGDFVYNPSLGNVGLGTTNPSTNLHIVSDKNALIKLVSTDANSGIQFIDPDTGAKPPVIYGVGDDFTVWTDFLERFRVKLDGDVEIGTAVTTSGLRYLDVQNLDTANDSGAILRLISSQSDGTGTTSGDFVKYKGGGLVINNNENNGTTGFISFGTTPDGGSSAVERLRITSTGQVEINGVDDQDNLVVNASGTQFAVHQDDTDGEISLRAQDGSGNNFTKYMTFFTENGSGPEERLRITEPGNVGIGSLIPSGKLDVFKDYNGLGAGNPAARIYGIDASVAETGIHFVEKGTGDLHNQSDAYLMRGISNGATKFVFGSNGKVGIGSTLPSKTLDVNGESQFQGKITAVAGIEVSNVLTAINNIDTYAVRRIGNTNTRVDFANDNEVSLNTNSGPILLVKNDRVGIGTDDPSYVLHTFNGGAVGSTENNRKYNGRFTTYTPNRLNLDIYDRRWQDTQTHGWHGTEKRIEYNIDDNANKRMWMSFFNPSSTTNDNVIRFGEQEDTEWMRIDNGNVGIGTDNPTAGLDVNISGTTQNDYIFLATAGGSDKFRIMGTGLVASYGNFAIGDRGGNVLNTLGDVNFQIYDTNPQFTLSHYDTSSASNDGNHTIIGASDGLAFDSTIGTNSLGSYFFRGKTTGPNPLYLKLSPDGAVISGITTHSGQVVYTPMTTTERDALTAQTGGVIFNSSTSKLQVYNGSAWVDLH